MSTGSQYITVIGNVFVDIKGHAFRPVHKDAKNVGEVEIVHGGVGRNVAYNLAVLDDSVRFVSSYTTGGLGDEVVAQFTALGVDTRFMKGFPDSGMGMWLAVLQPDGDLAVSISAQPELRYQEEAVLSFMDSYLQDCTLVGLDVGISQTVIQQVKSACKHRGIPVLGVVGNLDVVERNPALLEGLDVFVCNAEEASMLLRLEQRAVNMADATVAARDILGFGCGSAIITLADAGCVVADANGVRRIPAAEGVLVDSTGAGDAFFAGLLHGYGNGRSLDEAIVVASEVAARVVGTHKNTLMPGK